MPGFGGTTCTFSNGYWYQMALAYSPSNIAMYVNGALLATANFPPYYVSYATNGGVVTATEMIYQTNNGLTVWPTSDNIISLGSQGSAYEINGEFDELETFNYPLSAQAIAYGFATFNGCSTNNTTDTDYDGRSDLLEALVDNSSLISAGSSTPCRLGYWRFNSPQWIGELCAVSDLSHLTLHFCHYQSAVRSTSMSMSVLLAQ